MSNTLLIAISILLLSCGTSKQTEGDPNDDYVEILELIEKEKWNLAERRLTKLITLYPDNANLYFQRGYVREMDLNYEACISDFTKVISLDPGMHTVRT
ncbi:MAG: hypothetical protein AAFY91_07115, partial [Bacteroidota bacterium]